MSDGLDVIVFDEPSGDVIATMAATMLIGGKKRRLAHAYILTDKGPAITLDPPRALSLAELAEAMDLLARFEHTVHDLVAAYGPREMGMATSRATELSRQAGLF
ncbi:hypothetical protein KTD31_01615 [Burkholderia multivorans]|jgi:hypothetical protein|uniref:hypothetical protein n=1 Tax=Burkholderia multivorans TaxID=87883 RepID=UPI001C2211A5|nr:hypothetical protein [Burkholderia multivorans]MBU9200100.1 hypothetical protein [Burkholderia multivorans]MDN8078778.1 hypothetical protein [Burkholderia multivorans]